MIGLVLAASGHFPYGVKYSGTIVVANFNFAILMRNEVFGRLLYLFVNTCFAKVSGLLIAKIFQLTYPVATIMVSLGLHIRLTSMSSAILQRGGSAVLICTTASWRYSQRLRTLWRYLAPVQSRQQFSEAQRDS